MNNLRSPAEWVLCFFWGVVMRYSFYLMCVPVTTLYMVIATR
jgi:hypothetical protein